MRSASTALLAALLAAALSGCFEPVAVSSGDDLPDAAAPQEAADASTVIPADAGDTTPDAAQVPFDAGAMLPPDAGTVIAPDASTIPPDAGTVIAPDAGLIPADAGTVIPPDAGVVTGCLDNDKDNYGIGPKCLGPDCDDNDPTVHPGSPELCDGKDNDCTGKIDDVPPKPCSTACGSGTETCVNAKSVCSAPQPKPETCDGTDEDCNGIVDDGVTQACSSACGSGTQICSKGVFGACTARTPSAEICGDKLDNDCNGVVDDGCATLAGIFVDGTNGNDANTGAQTSPVKTLAKGIALATAQQQRVYVAGSTYAEDVILVEGVSLFGGWDKTFTSRNPATNVTTIQAVTVDAASGDARGLVVPATVTAKTVVDGFVIRAKSNPGGRSIGATVTGSPLFESCSFFGADGSSSAGILITSSAGFAVAQPTFRGVSASGGGANGPNGLSAGLVCTGSGFIFDGGAVLGGTARTTGQALTTSAAAWLTSCRAQLLASKLTGAATADQAIALYGSASDIVITDSQLAGAGTAGTGTIGVSIDKNTILYGARVSIDGGAGCGGQGGFGLAVNGASLQLDRSFVVGAANATNIGCETAGLYLVHAAARVTNSVIFGGEGNTANGVNVVTGTASGEVDLNANYINGGGNPRRQAISRGVNFETDVGSTSARGIVRNNIINGGAGQTAASAIRETRGNQGNSCGAGPRLVENNDLFHTGGNGGSYIDCTNGNTQVLTKASDVNALTASPSAAGNLTDDPKLTSETPGATNAFHLSGTTSPCYNAGTSAGAPVTDMDGEARPKSGSFDIGPDEL